MFNIADDSEYCKERTRKLLLELFSRLSIDSIFAAPSDLAIQNWYSAHLQIEVRLWALYRQDKDAFMKLFQPISNNSQKLKNDLELVMRNPPWPIDINDCSVDWQRKLLDLPLLCFYLLRSTKKIETVAPGFLRKFELPAISTDISPVPVRRWTPREYPVWNQQGETVASFWAPERDKGMMFPLINSACGFGEEHFPLYNLHLLRHNPEAVVFILDFIPAADQLQLGFLNYREKIFADDQKNAIDMQLRALELANEFHKSRLEDENAFSSKKKRFPQQNFYVEKNKNFRKAQEVLDVAIHQGGPPGIITEIIFSAYYGDGRLDYMRLTDFTSLSGHPVFLFVRDSDDEKQWLEDALARINILLKAEVSRLYLIRTKPVIGIINPEDSGLEILSANEVILRAIDMNLDIREMATSAMAEAFKTQRKVKSQDFLIDSILDRRSILLISAPSGVGKSIFSMNLGYALATKGKLINGWKVNSRCKVLYVCDAELDDRTFKKHCEKFEKLYGVRQGEYDFIREPVTRWQLMDEKERSVLEKKIKEYQFSQGTKGQPVSVVIFDSLNRLASDAHQDKNWGIFSTWLTSLQQEDISIILVHHSSKDSRRNSYLGTSKIQNDVDVHIHLEADEERNLPDCIPINMQVKKNRRSWLDRRVKKITLAWGKHPQWYDDDFELLKWRARPDTRIQKITEMRTEGLTSKAIAARYNVSHRSVEKFINDHPEIPKLNRPRKTSIIGDNE